MAVETLGPLSDEAHSLIAEIDRRAKLCTADPILPLMTLHCTVAMFSKSYQMKSINQ